MEKQTITIEKLASDVEQLRRELRFLQLAFARRVLMKEPPQPIPSATPPGMEGIVAEQLAAGMLVEPPPELLAWLEELKAEWEALPPDERRKVEEELENLRLKPSLSEIIIEMRS